MRDNGTGPGDAHDLAATDGLPVDPDVEVGITGRVTGRGSLAGRARRVLASRWDVLLVIALGGALGSLARWALGRALAGPGGFPWATFVENLSGGFGLGVLMVFVLDVWRPSRYVRPFFGVGVLGGYTTFSTYMLDTRTLIAADRVALAAMYLFGTVAAGLAAVWAGIFLGRCVAEPGNRGRRRRNDHVNADKGNHHPSHDPTNQSSNMRRQS